jgi:DNA-binding MarR family transcriptional regulator
MSAAADPGARADALAMLTALRKIGAGIDGYRRAVAAHLDLAIADLVAIGLLHHRGPQRASQIAEHTGLTPGSVTALLDRLHSRGYLTRIRPTEDRRRTHIALTPEGRALSDTTVQVLLPALARIVDDIGPDDCRIVIDALDRARAALVTLAADPALSDHFVPGTAQA